MITAEGIRDILKVLDGPQVLFEDSADKILRGNPSGEQLLNIMRAERASYDSLNHLEKPFYQVNQINRARYIDHLSDFKKVSFNELLNFPGRHVIAIVKGDKGIAAVNIFPQGNFSSTAVSYEVEDNKARMLPGKVGSITELREKLETQLGEIQEIYLSTNTDIDKLKALQKFRYTRSLPSSYQQLEHTWPVVVFHKLLPSLRNTLKQSMNSVRDKVTNAIETNSYDVAERLARRAEDIQTLLVVTMSKKDVYDSHNMPEEFEKLIITVCQDAYMQATGNNSVQQHYGLNDKYTATWVKEALTTNNQSLYLIHNLFKKRLLDYIS